MKKKKENNVEKRYDKFAIASFVLSLVSILIILIMSLVLTYTDNEYTSASRVAILLLIYFLILLIGIIFGIMSLVKIKRNNSLKGRGFAWFGIIISVLGLILSLIVLILIFVLTSKAV
ncbi:DUF4190 domain-containing protein [Candidatus Pacearchaeota archaeon]|nr:DUF4190 domain-containing protein [Candidatus Pacearchaeota archaeon]